MAAKGSLPGYAIQRYCHEYDYDSNSKEGEKEKEQWEELILRYQRRYVIGELQTPSERNRRCRYCVSTVQCFSTLRASINR